jgi:hypothetical protein
MNGKTKLRIAFVVMTMAVTSHLAAQPLSSYLWSGEVIANDAATETLTLRVSYREHLNRYIGRFTPGEKVMVIWGTPKPGETDAIIYMAGQTTAPPRSGYVLPIEFVSFDSGARQLTFKLPARAHAKLKAVLPGTWIKVTTPFSQPGETAIITDVDVSTAPATSAVSGPVR